MVELTPLILFKTQNRLLRSCYCLQHRYGTLRSVLKVNWTTKIPWIILQIGTFKLFAGNHGLSWALEVFNKTIFLLKFSITWMVYTTSYILNWGYIIMWVLLYLPILNTYNAHVAQMSWNMLIENAFYLTIGC